MSNQMNATGDRFDILTNNLSTEYNMMIKAEESSAVSEEHSLSNRHEN